MHSLQDDSGVVIRPVESGDLEAIVSVRVASFALSDSSSITSLGPAATRRYLEWMYGNPSDFSFICLEKNDRVVGYAIVARSDYRDISYFVRKDWLNLTLATLRSPGLILKPNFVHKAISIARRCVFPGEGGIGYVRGNKRDTCTLLDIAVHPGFQKMGIGSALLRAVDELVRSRKCNRITSSTQSVNSASVKLHERNGYTVVANEKGIVHMEKSFN